MIPDQRLEPAEIIADGACIRIHGAPDETEVVLYFKSEERAQQACQSIRNYIEIVDVDHTQDSVLHMLELVIGRPEEE